MTLPTHYVINLERNKDRWLNIKNDLEKHQLEYTRIEGYVYDPKRDKVLLAPETIKCVERGTRSFHKDHSQGSVGCYLAHRKALEAFLSSNHKVGIIAEDDISFAENYAEKYKIMEKVNLQQLVF